MSQRAEVLAVIRRRLPPRRRSARSARGATLIEVLLSMAVIAIGMLALFRVLSVASRGSSQAQHLTQALTRAQTVLEAMRTSPPAVLDCLSINPATQWSTCETLCLQWLKTAPRQTGTASAQACVFSTLANSMVDANDPTRSGYSKDGSKQSYAVVYDAANLNANSSYVQNTSPGRTVYDAQVTVGWKDDGTALATATCQTQQHCVTLRTSIYRDMRP